MIICIRIFHWFLLFFAFCGFLLSLIFFSWLIRCIRCSLFIPGWFLGNCHCFYLHVYTALLLHLWLGALSRTKQSAAEQIDTYTDKLTDRQTDIPISHTRALAHLKNTWFCATIAMQNHGLVNTLRASFYESSQRGLRAWRVSVSFLRALRDSQTLGDFESSLRARGPASDDDG